jgi:hypothetical protein
MEEFAAVQRCYFCIGVFAHFSPSDPHIKKSPLSKNLYKTNSQNFEFYTETDFSINFIFFRDNQIFAKTGQRSLYEAHGIPHMLS